MKRHIGLIVLVLAATWRAEASAQPVIDGTADASYGAALSVQDTRTQYGDGAANPDAILTGTELGSNHNGGSEIDQMFATVSGGRLYVTVSGNLEGNFNKLVVFLDSVDGGVNQLDGAALPGGFDGYCCGGFAPPNGGNATNQGGLQKMNGLQFDNTDLDPSATATFTADYVLSFTNGGEQVNPNLPGDVGFWAVSAHFADLTQGTAGAVGGLGMQLAPRGEPRALRGPGDYNKNGRVDAADYTLWRNTLGETVTNGADADGNANGVIDQGDYDNWKANFDRDTTIAGDAYKPVGNPGNTEALLGPSLPGLAQGELIDRDYALGAGGCTDDTGAGCIAKELEFALDVDPNEINEADPSMSNASSHRNFRNFVDLQMALDNSNIAGVHGSGGPFELVPGEDDPENVLTGIEFSIPLSEIGNPTGDVRIMAMISSGDFGGLSNQVSGDGIVGTDPIFGDPTGGNIDNAFFGEINPPDSPGGSFNNISGDQFVTVHQPSVGAASSVPEPTSCVLALVGAAFAGSFVRRRR